MRKISISMALVFLTLFILICSSLQANAYFTSLHNQNSRQALEIIIGGGGGAPSQDYPPPSQPECPPPPPPSPLPSPPPPPLPSPPPPPPSPLPLPSPPPPPPSPLPSPPPPPPKSPSPSPLSPTPPSSPNKLDYLSELKAIIPVIQKFGKRIDNDPKGIVKTWRGNKLCMDPSKYVGFICDKIPGDNKVRVAGVDFNGNNFNGKMKRAIDLTGFIDQLKDLVFFHANSNNFTSSIPAKIKKFTYFYELDLSNNKLRGKFPTSVLTFKNLTFLDLRFNSLTGTAPPEVFAMDLDVLFLNNNKFIGKIPDTIGKTPALYITLANNRFTGPIPRTIGQAKDAILEILLLNNRLSGCLPYEIGLLKRATVFDASQNQLTGPIPESFACLKSIALLNLSSNEFYGQVPETLCKLKTLYRLTLNDNYFTQVGPECRKLIRRRKLDVRMNCILGLPFQRSAAQCKHFFSLRRSCPRRRSMSYVPCRSHLQESSTDEESSDDGPTLVPAPSPSYAALEMHRP